MKPLSVSIALTSSLPLQLLLIIQLFQTPAIILAQNSTFLAFYDCPSEITNYTAGSGFESNLKNLLFPSLISNALSGFFNTSAGKDSNTIYGLVQCRFDVSTADCQSCLTIASVLILQRCPNKKDAALRLGRCLLRYSNIIFFSQMSLNDLRYADWYWSNDINITNLPVFNQQLGILFNSLMPTASSKPSKFATGSIKYDDSSNIYGLVDCTSDLSSADCSSCLKVMLSKLPGCCSGQRGAWVLSRSCEIWYRDIEFFGRSSLPSDLPYLPPPPPPPKTTVPGSPPP